MNFKASMQFATVLSLLIFAMASVLALSTVDKTNTIESNEGATAKDIAVTHKSDTNHLDARYDICPKGNDGERRCGTCINVYSEPDHKTKNNEHLGYSNPYDYCTPARTCIVAQKIFGFKYINSLAFVGNTTCVLSSLENCDEMDLMVDAELAEGGFLPPGGSEGKFVAVECERPN